MQHQTSLHLQAFVATDAELLKQMELTEMDYCCSTGVLAVMAHSVLTVGHVGDSRIALGRDVGTRLQGDFLTRDHKPNDTHELSRIQAAGGVLTFMHGSRPFLRGGDFWQRRRAGGRPMQLNYSRAFGGKDLKPFGLICEPTVLQLQLEADDRMLVLGSDGVWDVMTATDAVVTAHEAQGKGHDPAEAVVDMALTLHSHRGSADNVTAVVVNLCVSE